MRNLICACGMAAAFSAAALEVDTVVNGDFEAGQTAWVGGVFKDLGNGKPPKFRVEKNAGENGSTGLVYRNDDPKFYAFPQQRIQLVPGSTYEIRARYMTENLTTPVGATDWVGLCVECKDANGKFLHGIYTSGWRATDGAWKGIYQIGKIPTNAVAMTISPLVMRGFVGTVHFDSIEVTRVVCKPVIGLYASAYREQVAEDFDLVAGLDIKAAQIQKGDYDAVFTLPQADGTTKEVVATEYSDRKARVRVDVKTLPMGKSTFSFALRNRKTGVVRAEDRATRVVERLERLPARRVSIDAHNRLIVDGQPFFPLGLYWSQKKLDEADLAEYAKSPFNCLLNYRQHSAADMDACQRLGLKVIYTIEGIYGPGVRFTNEAHIAQWTRNAVLKYRNHPALLAWYMNDERGHTYVPQLTRRQALVRELDPDHPTYTVLYQLDIIDKYMETYDIIGTDPYPVSTNENKDDFRKCSSWVDRTVDGSFGIRPVWQVPQVFDWGVYHKNRVNTTHMPNVVELKNMFWQAIAGGANGLIGYSHFDIKRMDWKNPFKKVWADVCEAAEDVRRHIPIILSVETPPTVSSSNSSVRVRAWRVGEMVHVLAVNMLSEPVTTSVKIGDAEPETLDLPALGVKIWSVRQ